MEGVDFEGIENEDVPFHGEVAESRERVDAPLGLTVAMSREAGARGGSIARRVGKRMNWQVYTQELLEFLCANEAARQSILTDVPHDAAQWVALQLDRLRAENTIDPRAEQGEMPRLILTMASRGNVILVGRGAGFYLPRLTSLHIRIVAPIDDRIAHMADWLRMTPQQAAEQVHFRDERRAEFLKKHFGKRGSDPKEFDLILNSGSLYEETCTDAIVAAINGKREQEPPDSRMG